MCSITLGKPTRRTWVENVSKEMGIKRGTGLIQLRIATSGEPL